MLEPALDVAPELLVPPGLLLLPPPPLEGMEMVAPARMTFGLLIPLEEASTATETPVLAEIADNVSPARIV